MFFFVLLGLTGTFLSSYCIKYFQVLLDAFSNNNLTLKMIIFYGFILVFSTIIGYVDNYPIQKLKNGLYLNFKLQSLKKMKTINYLDYLKLGTGKLSQIVEDGSVAARDCIYQFWLRLIRELIPTAIFSLVFIYLADKRIIPFILIGYVFVIIITNFILKKLYSLKEKILVNQEYLNKHLIRGFMELVVFRTNKKYDAEIQISEKGISNIVDSKVKIILVHEMFFTVFALLVSILKVLVLVYALMNQSISIGSIVAIITLLGKAYEPIAIFNVEYIDYKLNKVALRKYINLLDLNDDPNIGIGVNVKNIIGNITFEDVAFSYNKKEIIKNLSFKIKSGEKIAFVGKSGSGKSTIIKVIIGLLKPNRGKILIDNYDISKLNLNSLYNYISYISQEAPIFDGTLRENIIFDKNVDDAKIIETLKLVKLDSFYSKLELGLDTELGEKGVLLSGGERQRVALARLFFDESAIIVLDEATSAMDNITEEEVINNIISFLQNKTFLIIAHRLNTIKNVNNIFVINDGAIIESGTYNELINKNSYFKKLSKEVK